MKYRLLVIFFVFVWGGVSGTHAQDATTTVLGTAQTTVSAASGPFATIPCTIEANEVVLAVGQTSDSLALYAAGKGCEGLVWVEKSDQASFTWESALDKLEDAIQPEAPARRKPLSDVADYYTVCEDSSFASNWPTAAPMIYAGGYNSDFNTDWLATSQTELNVLVCTSYQDAILENCPYTGGYTLTRARKDLVVKLVNYETGGYIAYQTFYGGSPDYCPYTIYVNSGSFGDTWYGTTPSDTDWIQWAKDRLGGRSGVPTATRTQVNSGTLNCRAEASTDSEILTQIYYGAPVNLIARNEAGDWLVALLPDMSKAWLFKDLISIAAQTDLDLLPVVDGPAADVAITLPQE